MDKSKTKNTQRVGRPKALATESEYLSAQVLHRWFTETGMTNKEVATHIGLRPNMMSMMKTGEVKIPVNHVKGIAEAMEKNPEELLSAVLEDHNPELLAMLGLVKKKTFSLKEEAILNAVREAQDEATEEGERRVPIQFGNNSLEKLKKFVKSNLI